MSGEIITDYVVAFERYGRPRGPFEKDRQCTYDATNAVKAGPKAEQRKLPLDAQNIGGTNDTPGHGLA
jgi:hypothetical protein